MSTGIIYCAHNIKTGKKYIGKTIRSLNERIYQHEYYSSKLNYRFYRSAQKYGWDNFIWGIIEECEIDSLEEKEKYWIEKFNTYKNGYNSTLGGEGGVNPNLCKSFKIMNPEGKILECENIRHFCRKYSLDRSTFVKVLNGKQPSHKGYKLPETKLTGLLSMVEKKSITYNVISPQGEIFSGKNVAQFCRDMDLKITSFHRLLKGITKQYRGWRLAE